ncbi:MAG: hypothetical protein A2381_08585 [Bdellovibrionales bacterium RIFOXYB1_FULL_37_110]|nr:MAG: hypothetical protein A2181_08780 [Bdellovibrionales bacterium RIFOXYA1_FULL_38_20]OFZ51244.1 MAG: hypothetical protein A2417_17575 [Bdellovibrionales bacterium RIFOXYC1_FULL_37_79]OFZ60900.1 MAG: hypothetical protein A2381_08585 [Bdellovibrionales bacterium RIFOXYB1_FULL_37_110]OFZ63644.1 MAG: hypothetical protein A2577_07705 [Bdellovibrionales bacterium RIFOXYD1_FULL_36_51]
MTIKELELLTMKEVIELFKVKESKVRRAIFKKEIPYIKLGGLIRFKKEHLFDWLSARTVCPRPSFLASDILH